MCNRHEIGTLRGRTRPLLSTAMTQAFVSLIRHAVGGKCRNARSLTTATLSAPPAAGLRCPVVRCHLTTAVWHTTASFWDSAAGYVSNPAESGKDQLSPTTKGAHYATLTNRTVEHTTEHNTISESSLLILLGTEAGAWVWLFVHKRKKSQSELPSQTVTLRLVGAWVARSRGKRMDGVLCHRQSNGAADRVDRHA